MLWNSCVGTTSRTLELLELARETIAAELFVDFLRGLQLTFVGRDLLFHAREGVERGVV